MILGSIIMKAFNIDCPNCGATININGAARITSCPYCGGNLKLQYENEKVYRTIDEAKIREVELHHETEIKRMQFEAQQRELNRIQYEKEDLRNRKRSRNVYFISLACLALGALMLLFNSSQKGEVYFIGAILIFAALMIAIMNYSKTDDNKYELRRRSLEMESLYSGQILLPTDFSAEEENYQFVEASLKGLGFSNIKSVNMRDLVIDLKKKNEKVESLHIGGKYYQHNALYNPDDIVVIQYHGFKAK